MKKTVFIVSFVVLTVFTLVPITSVMAGGILDGKVFETMLDGDKDVLTFQAGTFHSSSCDEWGFSKGEYSTSGSGDSISFEATTTSKMHGTMVWTGTVQGKKITGSYHWTKKGFFGTKSKTKNFEGAEKQ